MEHLSGGNGYTRLSPGSGLEAAKHRCSH
jgi:hypothetical protein